MMRPKSRSRKYLRGGIAAAALIVPTLVPLAPGAAQGEVDPPPPREVPVDRHESAPLSRATAAERGRIAYESDRDGDFEIFTLDPQVVGWDVKQLTGNSSADFEPTWSPDGDWIAFESDRAGTLDIWIMDGEGNYQHRLTPFDSSTEIEPAWSPDGRQIAFASDLFGSFDIFVVDVADPALPTRVTFGGNDTWPTWSPDGTHLAFNSFRDGNWEIYKVEMPGEVVNTPTNLTESGAHDRHPDWSPDGSRIAYDSDIFGGPHLWLMDDDGANQVWFTGLGTTASDREPAWSPDGAWIAFTSDRSFSDDDIMVVEVDGPTMAFLDPLASTDQAPDWQFNPLADSDGDALLDRWESYGYWGVGPGPALTFVDLPGLGANPNHKDLFIEVDWMDCPAVGSAEFFALPGVEQSACANGHSHEPDDRAIALVVEAFDDAGIHLHVDHGSDSLLLPWTTSTDTWGGLAGGEAISHDSLLGTTAYSWDEFDAVKLNSFSPARHRAFRYNVWGHRYNDGGSNSSSGIARGLPSSDFLVTLFNFNDLPNGSVRQQAGTFMHEMGHTLGLGHGGDDYVHYKPNYLSVMNYFFQLRWIPALDGSGSPQRVLDYSDRDLPDLDKRSLDESGGINGGAAVVHPTGSTLGTAFFVGGKRTEDNNARSVNWNNSGGVDDTGLSLDVNGLDLCALGWGNAISDDSDALQTTAHADDLVYNHPDWGSVIGPGSDGDCDTAIIHDEDTNTFLLSGFDDWDHLVFDGGLVGAGAPPSLPMVTDSVALRDITAEEAAAHDAEADNPPPPGPDGPMVGLVDPSSGLWELRDPDGTVNDFYFGNPGDIPFLGDWDCDGIDTPGLFRQSDAFAYLRNANTQGIADIRFFFGNPSDVPLAGDFNGDGCDTLSIYRPSEQRFYIVNRLGQNEGGLGAADYSFEFGNPGDQPVVGDWNGDGVDEIGLHRESTGFFYFRYTLDTGIASDEFFFGDPGDRFITGDWGVVDIRETPAVFRPSATTFYFRHTLTEGIADDQFTWGTAQSVPVAGRFG